MGERWGRSGGRGGGRGAVMEFISWINKQTLNYICSKSGGVLFQLLFFISTPFLYGGRADGVGRGKKKLNFLPI